MKLQPTAHETLQLSVNSQQVTQGLFTFGTKVVRTSVAYV